MKNKSKKTDLHHEIKALREALEMNKREFSRCLKVSPSFIGDMESGRKMPGHELLERIVNLALRNSIEIEVEIGDFVKSYRLLN